MEKTYTFKGEEYSSYYQLEKVMGIPRRTIQYRHEKLGLSIDDVPHYQSRPKIENFGDKRMEFAITTKKETNSEELKQIIEYPKNPGFRIDNQNENRTEESKEIYAAWLKDAPETLVRRELFIHKTDLDKLIKLEEDDFFFRSIYHDDKKEMCETAIQIIKDVAAKRNIEIQ